MCSPHYKLSELATAMERHHLAAASGHIHLAATASCMAKAAGRASHHRAEDPCSEAASHVDLGGDDGNNASDATSSISINVGSSDDDISVDVTGCDDDHGSTNGGSGDDGGGGEVGS